MNLYQHYIQHHNAAQHHSTSALPAVSMEEFRKQGGVLGGRGEKYDGFEGEPRAIGKALGGHDHAHTGPTAPHVNVGATGSTVQGTTGTRDNLDTGRGGTAKPSMMDKLNPMKDADHDGKKGFMD